LWGTPGIQGNIQADRGKARDFFCKEHLPKKAAGLIFKLSNQEFVDGWEKQEKQNCITQRGMLERIA